MSLFTFGISPIKLMFYRQFLCSWTADRSFHTLVFLLPYISCATPFFEAACEHLLVIDPYDPYFDWHCYHLPSMIMALFSHQPCLHPLLPSLSSISDGHDHSHPLLRPSALAQCLQFLVHLAVTISALHSLHLCLRSMLYSIQHILSKLMFLAPWHPSFFVSLNRSIFENIRK